MATGLANCHLEGPNRDWERSWEGVVALRPRRARFLGNHWVALPRADAGWGRWLAWAGFGCSARPRACADTSAHVIARKPRSKREKVLIQPPIRPPRAVALKLLKGASI